MMMVDDNEDDDDDEDDDHHEPSPTSVMVMMTMIKVTICIPSITSSLDDNDNYASFASQAGSNRTLET